MHDLNLSDKMFLDRINIKNILYEMGSIFPPSTASQEANKNKEDTL